MHCLQDRLRKHYFQMKLSNQELLELIKKGEHGLKGTKLLLQHRLLKKPSLLHSILGFLQEWLHLWLFSQLRKEWLDNQEGQYFSLFGGLA
ncbi:unnamed protein product [Blepharisma stoltei]|uniref:Maturase K n=1 Tax=Blepharisma stoltei TaxID=1481888 RepID=A0AAU9K788_9CILI|nr:unnamed protein product [Blepharisma stoltei]